MSAAASVRYPVAPSRRLGTLLLGAAVLGWLLVLAWIADGWSAPWPAFWPRAALLLVLQGAVTAALWQTWRRLPRGWLAFDGQGWTLQTQAPEAAEFGRAAVALDLQRAVLIRLWEPGGRPANHTWVWADGTEDSLRWHVLRGALYARAAVQGGADASAVPQPPAL